MKLEVFKIKSTKPFAVLFKNKHLFITSVFIAIFLSIIFSALAIWYSFSFFHAFSYKIMTSFIIIILLSNLLAKFSIDLIKSL